MDDPIRRYCIEGNLTDHDREFGLEEYFADLFIGMRLTPARTPVLRAIFSKPYERRATEEADEALQQFRLEVMQDVASHALAI